MPPWVVYTGMPPWVVNLLFPLPTLTQGNIGLKSRCLSDRSSVCHRTSRASARGEHRDCHTFGILRAENASHPWVIPVLSLVDSHRAPRPASVCAAVTSTLSSCAGWTQGAGLSHPGIMLYISPTHPGGMVGWGLLPPCSHHPFHCWAIPPYVPHSALSARL